MPTESTPAAHQVLARSSSSRTGVVALVALLLVTASVAAVATWKRDPVTAAPTVLHGDVVPETVRSDFPQILDGQVFAADQVGSRIVVGGDFTSIRMSDGSVVSQPNVAAFFVDSGAFDTSFRPAIDGRVQAIEPGDDNTVYLGGKFNTVDEANISKLVKWDFDVMGVDTTFRANANNVVRDIEFASGRLFVGGNFTTIRGVARGRLAELDPRTGAVAALDLPIEGDRGVGQRADGFVYRGRGALVRELDVTPDGSSLLVMHRGDTIAGERRWGAALIDLTTSSPTLRPWNTNFWPADRFVGTVDGEMSPDGSYFVLVSQVGNFAPHHDTTVAFPLTDVNDSDVAPLWVTQMFDSVYSVAITETAVYVGGHFCWTEGPGSVASPLYVPGANGNQYSCEAKGASQWQPQTVERNQIAALEPSTGHALAWNPGSNSFNGVRALEAVERGLILGHDGSVVGGVNTGRMAFFDLGAEPDVEAPVTDRISPAASDLAEPEVRLSGQTVDNVAVQQVVASLRDRDTQQWLRNDGTWGAWEPLELTVDGIGTPVVIWDTSVVLADGNYVLKIRGFDVAGNRHPLISRQFMVATNVDTEAPTATVNTPSNDAQLFGIAPVIMSGMAADNVGIDRIVVTVRDVETREFLQADGSWGRFAALPDVVFTADASSTAWNLTRMLEPGSYQLRVVTKDSAGNKSDAVYVPFNVS